MKTIFTQEIFTEQVPLSLQRIDGVLMQNINTLLKTLFFKMPLSCAIYLTNCKNCVDTKANILITNSLSYYYMHYYRYPVLADNSENCMFAIC